MYILKISNKAFIKIEADGFLIISDYKNATTFSTIGDAMRKASELNEIIERPIIEIISTS